MSKTPLRLTRRQGLGLLAALAAATGLSACGGEAPEVNDPVDTTAPPAPDLAEAVAGEELALIALYDAALASLPEADERRRTLLTALRQQHVEHRDALAPDVTAAPDGEAPAGGRSDTAPVSPGLRDLAAAERKATKARIRACVEADDPQLARTLAFIAASESSHVPALVEAL